MKLLKRIIPFFILLSISVLGNGIGIVDAHNGVYLKLVSSEVEVYVENQVAIIKTIQEFRNELSSDTTFKYAFPLANDASATDLKWKINGQWFQAAISPTPGDTSLPGPGGDPHPDLLSYLGDTPLYFNIDDTLAQDSIMIVELTYVQLLTYEFGDVQFTYPNDYQLIQSTQVELQKLDFTLVSTRTIDDIQMLSSHPTTQLNNTGNLAEIQIELFEEIADEDYEIQYTLDLSQLGLFGFSTLIPDSLVPDTLGGFLLFVAEPDPTQTTGTIDKVFTLIIDRSGSMGGNKIVQARDAASFIVDSLNIGDKFNIVDFATYISSFRNGHVPYTIQSRDSALTYIASLNATGSTNISGAFDVAVPQFSAANDSTANIIIFFTDGQANGGITNTQLLVDHINQLITNAENNIMVFCFGIGSSVNEQLLTLIASNNNGLSEFLKDDELYSRITKFYLKIRNPVLLNTSISFTPPIVHEIYPSPLPNLYKGQQMLVTGRYQQAQSVTIDLNGTAFAQPVNYQFNLSLSDSNAGQYQFLTKVWAKQKIENLLIQYYAFDPNSSQALALKQQIIDLSLAFGVITPFTSFSNPTDIEIDEDGKRSQILNTFELIGNYPNPFNSSTNIRFQINHDFSGIVIVKIYNTLGRVVKLLSIHVNGAGVYKVFWKGDLNNNQLAPSGTYFYTLDFGDALLVGKMILLK
jgi:Ca-activated chloride channel homolog